MKRVVTAVTRAQRSQLVGMSYEDMLSFLSDNREEINRGLEEAQTELEKKVDELAPAVKNDLVHLVETLFQSTKYGTYNSNNLETSYYVYDGNISHGRRYGIGYVAPTSYENVVSSRISYYVSDNGIKYGFSAYTYEVNGKMRKCTVTWNGPDRITSRNKEAIDEKEFMDVRQVYTQLNSNNDLITSTLRTATEYVGKLQKEVNKINKQPKLSTRALFWSWFYVNKVVLLSFDDIYYISGVKPSGVPNIQLIKCDVSSEGTISRIYTVKYDYGFLDNDRPQYLLDCSLDDVMSGKVVRNYTPSNPGTVKSESLTFDDLTCSSYELDCPRYVRDCLRY